MTDAHYFHWAMPQFWPQHSDMPQELRAGQAGLGPATWADGTLICLSTCC